MDTDLQDPRPGPVVGKMTFGVAESRGFRWCNCFVGSFRWQVGLLEHGHLGRTVSRLALKAPLGSVPV